MQNLLSFRRMNPKLFLLAFWSLAYIVNGQTPPPPSPPPPGIPTPSKALTMEDLPSQDQIMMDMAEQNFPPPEGDMRNTLVNTQELPPRPVSEMIPRAADGTIQDPSDMRLPSPGFNVGQLMGRLRLEISRYFSFGFSFSGLERLIDIFT